MAVTALPRESMPDIPKLVSMGRRTVLVTKIVGPNREQTIVNGIGEWANAPVERILAFQTELPALKGAGFYRFRVVDGENGPDVVEWSARLGGAGQDLPEGSPMALNGTSGDPQVVHQLGNGATYNETLGLLSTRAGGLYPWRPGEPLPVELQRASGPSSPAPGNFGYASPLQVDPNSGRGIEALLQMERDRGREDKLERLIVESNQRFERLVERLAEKPHGPDPQIEALKAQLEETKRQAAERATEDRHRAELAVLREEMKTLATSLQGNRQDPMLMLLGQIITAMQASASQQGSQVKEVAQLITTQMGGSAMTPERVLEMIRLAKDRGADGEVMRNALDMYKQLFGMSQDVLKMQQELAQGNAPQWWESALEKLGGAAESVAQHYAANTQEKAAQAEHQRRVQAEMLARRQAAQRRQQAGTVQTPPAPAAPAPAAAKPVTPDAVIPPKKKGRPKKNGASHDLKTVPVEVLRDLMTKYEDEVFFGPFFESVTEGLRKPVALNKLGFYEAAQFMLKSRQWFQQAAAAGQLPPAAELMMAGQIEVLVERALPLATAEFRAQVIESIRAQLQVEAGGQGAAPPDDGGEGDEEEGDPDGEEAAA